MEHCMRCHGLHAVAAALPDLRYSSKETLQNFEGIVLGGARSSGGMPSFRGILKSEQVSAIQAYVVSRALESAQAADKGKQ